MTTLAHEVTWYIADTWDGAYASAVLSGIVGDPDHMENGGYHVSIEDNSSTNYSVTRPDDKAPPGTWPRNLAAAIDMSMNPADMKLCSDRLWGVWNDQSDPRRIYINAFNGWFNDGGPAKRYDFVTQGISNSSSDHKWHVHLEIRRKWVTDWVAANAIISILIGQSKADYISNPSGGYDEMYAKLNMGLNGSPISHDTMQLQEQLAFLRPESLTHATKPLTVDGKYGPNTAYWVSLQLTGGAGDEVNGKWFAILDQQVTDKKIADALAALPPSQLPDQIQLTLPATTVSVPDIVIPETTIVVDVAPV